MSEDREETLMDSWRTVPRNLRTENAAPGRADCRGSSPVMIGLIPALLAVLAAMLPGDAAGVPRFSLREPNPCATTDR